VGLAPINPRNEIYEEGGFEDREDEWFPDDVDEAQ
jgi:hypothetical protein